MFWNKKLSQTGDTIIEVLIVMAILGFAFSISSATASKSLQQSRNAEEHSQAMGDLNSQLELLRKAIANGVSIPTVNGDKFCMTSPTTFEREATNPTACESGTIGMKRTIQPKANTLAAPQNNSHYDLSVSWDGTGSSGRQTETFTYKVGGPQVSTLPWEITPAPTSNLRVSVNKAVPPSGSTSFPNCSTVATVPRTGLDITIRNLTKPSNPAQTRASAGPSAVADFLIGTQDYGDNFRVTANNLSGFTICPPTSRDVRINTANVDLSVKIVPQCTLIQDPSYIVNETRHGYTYSYAGEVWHRWKYLQTNPNPYSPAAPPDQYENHYSNGVLYDRYVRIGFADESGTRYQDLQRARGQQTSYFDSNGRSRSDGRQSFVDRYYNRYMIDPENGFRYYFTARTSDGGHYFYDGSGSRFNEWTGNRWGYNQNERFPSFGEMRGSMNKSAMYRLYNNRIYYYNYGYLYTPPPRRQCAS